MLRPAVINYSRGGSRLNGWRPPESSAIQFDADDLHCKPIVSRRGLHARRQCSRSLPSSSRFLCLHTEGHDT